MDEFSNIEIVKSIEYRFLITFRRFENKKAANSTVLSLETTHIDNNDEENHVENRIQNAELRTCNANK